MTRVVWSLKRTFYRSSILWKSGQSFEGGGCFGIFPPSLLLLSDTVFSAGNRGNLSKQPSDSTVLLTLSVSTSPGLSPCLTVSLPLSLCHVSVRLPPLVFVHMNPLVPASNFVFVFQRFPLGVLSICHPSMIYSKINNRLSKIYKSFFSFFCLISPDCQIKPLCLKHDAVPLIPRVKWFLWKMFTKLSDYHLWRWEFIYLSLDAQMSGLLFRWGPGVCHYSWTLPLLNNTFVAIATMCCIEGR